MSACAHTCAQAIPVALLSLPSFWEVSWGKWEVQGVCFFLGCSRPAACLPAEDMAIQFLMVFYVNLRGLGLLQAKDFGLLGYSER